MGRWAFVVATLLASTEASGCQVRYAGGTRLPPGRVARFEMTMRDASVSALNGVPAGWRLFIHNDGSWMTRFGGAGEVGAAYLQADTFLHWFALGPGPGLSCRDVGAKGGLRLRLGIYSPAEDRVRTVTLGPSSLRVIDGVEPARPR